MLNFILMDDDMNHNHNMKKGLEYIFRKYDIEADTMLTATEPYPVLEYSIHNSDEYNVYLLDVDFGCDINGVELALKIRENDVLAYIVFVSGHPEFVMSSLKAKIFDFLVKPISLETLEKCIVKIYKDFILINKNKRTLLAVKSGFHVYQINTQNIFFLEKYGHLLIIHTNNGQIRSKESLDNIMTKLDHKKFYKCHKSYLVNLDQITEIDNENNCIYFNNGESCLFSKRCKKELNLLCSVI